MSEERDDLPSERESEVTRGGRPSLVRRVAVYAVVALVAFLLGLVPMWLKARTSDRQREAAQRELRVSRMQNSLASTAVDAQRGEYEPARQAASEFFTALREQADLAGDDSSLTAAQRDGLRPLLAQRDDVITLLARSDPASSVRLFDMYTAFRKALASVPPAAK